MSVTLALCAIALCGWAQAPNGRADAQRYLEDIKALTAPAMEGRGDGTKGLARAAHLIEARFKSLGLEPAGASHTYYQPFTLITGARLKGENYLHAKSGKEKYWLLFSIAILRGYISPLSCESASPELDSPFSFLAVDFFLPFVGVTTISS